MIVFNIELYFVLHEFLANFLYVSYYFPSILPGSAMTLRGIRGDDGYWRKAEGIGNQYGVDLIKELRDTENTTVPAILKYSAEKHGNLPCMATRTVILRNFEEVNGKRLEKMELGDYVWLTYKETYAKVIEVSRGLGKLGIQPKSKLAIFAETRADWYICAVGCLNAGLTLVTLYTNLHDDSVSHGILETKVDTILTSYELLPRLSKIISKCDNIRRIVVLEDQLEGCGDTTAIPESVEVVPFASLKKRGSESTMDDLEGPNSDDIAIIMYTSGSTGNPKGVQLSHRNIFCSIGAYAVQAYIGPGDCYLAYLPLAHVMELATETALIAMGVSIAYSSPHTLTNNSPKIMKGTSGDAAVARPTVLGAVPLILDRIIKGVTANVEKQGKMKAKIFSESLRYKQSVNGNGGLISRMLDGIIFSKVKAELGGRVKMMVCGGAPLSSRTHKMIRAMFGASIQIGYGATETTACATSSDRDDERIGHSGPPNPDVLIKLEDWEEGGYMTTDKPRPRGEVIVGGDCVAVGYYNLPEENKLSFFEENGVRWFRTGDIGEFDEFGCLHIVDRMKDLVKLQHGEYVSLGSVEAALKTHSLVDNICVFADGNHNSTVAVVVPSVDYLKKMANTAGKPDTLSHNELCSDKEIIACALGELQSYGKKQKLNRSEIPSVLFLSSEQWTPDNGLVTAALKLRRKPLKEHYLQQISNMYSASK